MKIYKKIKENRSKLINFIFFVLIVLYLTFSIYIQLNQETEDIILFVGDLDNTNFSNYIDDYNDYEWHMDMLCISRDESTRGSKVCEWDLDKPNAEELCWEAGECDAYVLAITKSNCYISQKTDQVYCS